MKLSDGNNEDDDSVGFFRVQELLTPVNQESL